MTVSKEYNRCCLRQVMLSDLPGMALRLLRSTGSNESTSAPEAQQDADEAYG